MNRTDNFTMRVSPAERDLLTAVAKKLERVESDALRLLVRREAQRLDIAPAAAKEERHVAQPAN
jgi:hypothetical protein